MVEKVAYSRSPEEYVECLKHMVTFLCSKCFNAVNGDYNRPAFSLSLVMSLEQFCEDYELDPIFVDELLQFINERLR